MSSANSYHPSLRLAAVTVLLTALMAIAGCRPEIVILLETRIHLDGSCDRKIEISGWDSEGNLPAEKDWLEDKAGIALADPEAWNIRESEPGYLLADGFFNRTEDIPGSIRHVDEPDATADHDTVEFMVEDLVVLDRMLFRETYGDPYGMEHAGAALDRLLELFLEALHNELRLSFGDKVDPGPVDAFFRDDFRSMILELLETERRLSGPDAEERSAVESGAILHGYGVHVVATDPEEFWDTNSASTVEWMGRRIASGLSTLEHPLTIDDIDFWPRNPEDSTDKLVEIMEKHWGGEEELSRLVDPLITTLIGYYSSSYKARYRFRVNMFMPGRILRTNGTWNGESLTWFFRADDLGSGSRVMEAESVELNVEALRALGGRTAQEPAALLEIVDVLTQRDPEGRLKEILGEAVSAGKLDSLREPEKIPDDLAPLARELADLLDPEVDYPRDR